MINHADDHRATPRRQDFCPGYLSHSIGWNPLQNVPPDDHYLVASQVVLSLKAIWGDSWGPRMEYILLASVMLLLARKGSLVQLPRLLSDRAFRDQITRKLSLDPFLRQVWVTEFANKDRHWWEEAISPIQNKIGVIMLSPHLRQVLGQPSTIDLRHVMDAGKILVCNLAKGRLGMAANLLGSLLVSAFYRTAESRIDTPEQQRRPFTLIADEFQNFATDSFEEILSESRKWKLQLVASHQTLSQISPELQDALLANVGTLVAFRVGGKERSPLGRRVRFHATPLPFRRDRTGRLEFPRRNSAIPCLDEGPRLRSRAETHSNNSPQPATGQSRGRQTPLARLL